VVQTGTRAQAPINWSALLAETDRRMDELRRQLTNAATRPQAQQAEIRDHLARINKEIMHLLSDL
jgi:hypothetical protein